MVFLSLNPVPRHFLNASRFLKEKPVSLVLMLPPRLPSYLPFFFLVFRGSVTRFFACELRRLFFPFPLFPYVSHVSPVLLCIEPQKVPQAFPLYSTPRAIGTSLVSSRRIRASFFQVYYLKLVRHKFSTSCSLLLRFFSICRPPFPPDSGE